MLLGFLLRLDCPLCGHLLSKLRKFLFLLFFSQWFNLYEMDVQQSYFRRCAGSQDATYLFRGLFELVVPTLFSMELR